jgi:hypothetical protein
MVISSNKIFSHIKRLTEHAHRNHSMTIASAISFKRVAQTLRWVGFATTLFFSIAFFAALTLTDVGWGSVVMHVGFMFKIEHVDKPMFWAFWIAIGYYPVRLIFDDQKRFLP